MKLHASVLRQKIQISTPPLHILTVHNPKSRPTKETIFQNSNFTLNYDTDPNNCTENITKLNSTPFTQK